MRILGDTVHPKKGTLQRASAACLGEWSALWTSLNLTSRNLSSPSLPSSPNKGNEGILEGFQCRLEGVRFQALYPPALWPFLGLPTTHHCYSQVPQATPGTHVKTPLVAALSGRNVDPEKALPQNQRDVVGGARALKSDFSGDG